MGRVRWRGVENDWAREVRWRVRLKKKCHLLTLSLFSSTGCLKSRAVDNREAYVTTEKYVPTENKRHIT